MITIFNRKELCTTFDMKEQARVRDILAGNNIDYSVKTINRMSTSPVASGERGRTGTYGQNSENMYEYIIYVRKADFEKAMNVVGK